MGSEWAPRVSLTGSVGKIRSKSPSPPFRRDLNALNLHSCQVAGRFVKVNRSGRAIGKIYF